MTTNGYLHAVAIGRYPDIRLVHKFGKNPALANGTYEPITSAGAINWLTTADEVRIAAGGNANDTAAGTGAREVTVVGLDDSWAEVTETIATAGESASATTTAKFFRVYRAYVSEVGSYGGSQAADIAIETEGGTAMLTIPSGEGQSQHAAYTVPAGRKLTLVQINVQVDATLSADFRLWARPDANNTGATYRAPRVVWHRDGVSGETVLELEAPIVLDPYADVWMEGLGNGANIIASVELCGIETVL